MRLQDTNNSGVRDGCKDALMEFIRGTKNPNPTQAALNGNGLNSRRLDISIAHHRTEENENFNRALSVRRDSSSFSLAFNAVYTSSAYCSPSCG